MYTLVVTRKQVNLKEELIMSDFMDRCSKVLVGGATGASAGGAIGAGLGTVFAPVTSAVGATIGGAVGTICGLFAD